jgi:hypothetical protein
MLGTFTGGEQRGYCGVLTKACLMDGPASEQGKLSPNEQLSNLAGSVIGWCDDFAAASSPLSAEKLRQISGNNSLTAARKNKGELTFKFNGMLVLLCNGLWTIKGKMVGADLRRFVRQQMLVTFANEPKGPMQRQKDKYVKDNVKVFVPELWWLSICYHHIVQARCNLDRTMPLPPTAVASLAELEEDSTNDALDEAVAKFVKEKVELWVPSETLPPAASEMERACEYFCGKEDVPLAHSDLYRQALRRHMVYKPGHTINKFGQRKKTTVNCYLLNGQPAALQTIAASSKSSSLK